MNDSSEFIGSMPSTPQPQAKPQPVAPAPAASAGNPWSLVSYFLCSACLLFFPVFANMDELGTGVFFGMGLFLLLVAFIGLCRTLARRAKKNRPPQALQAQPGAGRLRWLRWLNGVLVGVVFFLLGIYVMMAPVMPGGSDMSLVGVFICILGLAVVCWSLIRLISDLLVPAKAQPRPVTAVQSQSRANSIRGGIYELFLAGGLLVFAHAANLAAFVRGTIYGVGLLLLLVVIIGLNSLIIGGIARKAA